MKAEAQNTFRFAESPTFAPGCDACQMWLNKSHISNPKKATSILRQHSRMQIPVIRAFGVTAQTIRKCPHMRSLHLWISICIYCIPCIFMDLSHSFVVPTLCLCVCSDDAVIRFNTECTQSPSELCHTCNHFLCAFLSVPRLLSSSSFQRMNARALKSPVRSTLRHVHAHSLPSNS